MTIAARTGTAPPDTGCGPAPRSGRVAEGGDPTSASGTGAAFGTFGELLQGVLPDGSAFLVTLPVDVWARARFRLGGPGPQVRVRPPGKHKARQVARLVLDAVGHGGGGLLELSGELPEGKGLASSSADLVATVRAVGAAVGVRFTPAETEAFLRGIEPSDGVMYDEIVAFHHRAVRLRRRLGRLRPLVVVAHDEGGQVDTVRHNRGPLPFGAQERSEYARLLAELDEAVAGGDLAAVGRVSTRSAELNALVRPRAGLAPLRDACREADGIGLVLAHSGTMLGVAFAADDPELADKSDYVRRACAAWPGTVSVFRTLGEGSTWSAPADAGGET
ncbi:kinase [Streptomyces sp. NPDC005202]|uniref:GHMP family kinase ATP-binding protein n=1 Tax=Streptomyces sp. NPDC005202 TaxID=3157021 RepID=UPI0033B8EAA8